MSLVSFVAAVSCVCDLNVERYKKMIRNELQTVKRHDITNQNPKNIFSQLYLQELISLHILDLFPISICYLRLSLSL